MTETAQGPQQGPQKTGWWRRALWLALAGVAFLVALGIVLTVEDTADVTTRETERPRPPVRVVSVAPQTGAPILSSFATVRPFWAVDLLANASGRVIEVTDQALAGRRVAQGDILVRIEDSALQAELQGAEQALAEARFDLLRAENRSDLARRELNRTGIQVQSDLRLHLPQLRIAQKAVTAAVARRDAARTALAQAEVRAPFDGFVTARQVSPGQNVVPGDVLLNIVGNTRFEVEAGLSEAQWQLLEHPVQGRLAQVLNLSGQQVAQARIREAGGFRDSETREFKVFLELDRPKGAPKDAQLLSGDLVRVAFRGKPVPNVLLLPEASLTREGYVWHVDPDDRLARIEATPLWREAGRVAIAAPEPGQSYRVVQTPLASYMAGLAVAPQTVQDSSE
jgi:RND family efflux transporter MFP subunit